MPGRPRRQQRRNVIFGGGWGGEVRGDSQTLGWWVRELAWELAYGLLIVVLVAYHIHGLHIRRLKHD